MIRFRLRGLLFAGCIVLAPLAEPRPAQCQAEWEVDTLETVIARFPPPPGFERVVVAPESFAAWLRRLPMKRRGAAVLDYRGRMFRAAGDARVAGVIALDMQGRKLEQCMDVLVRLLATWRRNAGSLENFILPLPGGTQFSWREWRAGLRPVWNGQNYAPSPVRGSADSSFQAYLNTVYNLSSTQTFVHALHSPDSDSVRPGDIFTRRGNDGHAVMLLDVARDRAGNRMGLILQGDTPACEPHILANPEGGAWIPLRPKSGPLPLPIRKKMEWRGLRRF